MHRCLKHIDVSLLALDLVLLSFHLHRHSVDGSLLLSASVDLLLKPSAEVSYSFFEKLFVVVLTLSLTARSSKNFLLLGVTCPLFEGAEEKHLRLLETVELSHSVDDLIDELLVSLV